MNRALINPFEANDLPRGIEEYLEEDKGTCMRFNRHGNLLAVGTSTGKVVLWDFDTLSIAAVLESTEDATSCVTSVSFPAPRNGSTVLVSYQNGLVRVYDTLTASIAAEVKFKIPILQAVAHPKVGNIAIVVPKDSHPLVLHLQRGRYEADTPDFKGIHDPEQLVRLGASRRQAGISGTARIRQQPHRSHDAFGNKKFTLIPNRAPSICLSVLCDKNEFNNGTSVENTATRRKNPFCVAFTRGGQYILRGGPTGVVRAFQLGCEDPDVDPTVVAVCKSVVAVQGKAAIRSIQLSKTGQILINSQDRSMRLFSIDQILKPSRRSKQTLPVMEPTSTFTEIVNKSQCKSACFSTDGDFVLGGMDGTDHRIHVWRATDGFLDVTLEGPREGIVDILWHPMRPVLASLGSGRGGVYIWMKNFTENWSAFASEFNELEANEEYKETEDEFDLKEPEDEEKRLEEREKAEAKDVDVETVDKTGWFSSDSDEEDTFFYIPAVPAPDSKQEYSSLVNDIVKTKQLEMESEWASRVEDSEIEVEEIIDLDGDNATRKRPRPSEGRDAGRTMKEKRGKTIRKHEVEANGELGDKSRGACTERPPRIPGRNGEAGSTDREKGRKAVLAASVGSDGYLEVPNNYGGRRMHRKGGGDPGDRSRAQDSL